MGRECGRLNGFSGFLLGPVFQVPRSSLNEEVMFLTVQVKGPTQEFKRRTTVLVKNEESLVFVQTDKPIYKPGQTGKKRPTVRTTSKRKDLLLLPIPQSKAL